MPVSRLLVQCLITSIQKDILEHDTMVGLSMSIKFKHFVKKGLLKLLISVQTNGVSMYSLFQDHQQILQFIQDFFNLTIELCH